MRRFLVAAAFLGIACVTAPPVSSLMHVDRETTQQCQRHCADLGMRLGAIVIIRDSTGCVCEPNPEPATTPRASAGVMGGAIAYLDDEVRRREEERKHEEQRRKDDERRQQQQRDEARRQADAVRAR